jgi:hypothetical protein
MSEPGRGPLLPLEQERERAIDLLSQHFAHDHLTVEELERRLELAYRARSTTELQALLADLEGRTAAPAPNISLPAPVVPDHDRFVSVMGENQRRGVWAAPQQLDVVAVMSDTTIDLTQATLPTGIMDVRVKGLMSSVKLIVPPGVRVADRVGSFMASVQVRPDDAPTRPDLPVIWLTGWAVMCEVQVKTRRREGEALPGSEE